MTVEVVRTLDDWAAIVRADLTDAVQGFINAGTHLIEAKQQHPGTFVAWLETGVLGFGPRHAQRLMAIGRTLGTLDATCQVALPANTDCAYELSRLEPGQVAAAIAAGGVAPDMTRGDAQALVRAYRLDGRADEPPEAPGLPDGAFSTIAADPPWQYDNAATRNRTRYKTMTIDQLCKLDVARRAADNAHLYLWTTNNFLREAFDVLEAWGFAYKTCLTWVKPQIGMGNYFRSVTEHIFFGVRGSMRTNSRSLTNAFEADRTRHSVKPGAFYDLVEKASPGPYLEMFSRQTRTGWTSWGDEI